MPPDPDERYLVIFDGVCCLCSGAVNFIIKRDPHGKFCFTPMQTPLAQELMAKYGVDGMTEETFLLIKQGKCHVRTNAALEITKGLSGAWCLFNIFRIVPAPLRDCVYCFIARHRYRWFGCREQCMTPTSDNHQRFVGL